MTTAETKMRLPIYFTLAVALWSVGACAIAQNKSFTSERDGLLWVLPTSWQFTQQKLPASLARATKTGSKGNVACTIGIDRDRPARPGISDDARVRGFDSAWHLRQAEAVGAQELQLVQHTFTKLNGKPASMAEMNYTVQSPDRSRRYSALVISSPRGTDLINFNCLVPSDSYSDLRAELLSLSSGISISSGK